uniref:Ammonium_transp domain-containing protein n=1 Tax=Angiostrongylus cantonensis TaxID=6313 RepID=A0A0K0CW64_ANGCA
MASCAAYALFAGTSVQIRIIISGGQGGEQLAQDPLDTSPIKISLVSGFLTGLLVLHIIGYFISTLINIWCFNIVMDCYRWMSFHLEEKNRANGRKDVPVSRSDSKPMTGIHATDF